MTDTITTTTDPRRHQVDGDHYSRHRIQPWDIIAEYDLDFWEGNALKYLLRRKAGVSRATDLRKARHYLDHCLARLDEAAATLAPAPIPPDPVAALQRLHAIIDARRREDRHAIQSATTASRPVAVNPHPDTPPTSRQALAPEARP